MSEDLRRRSLSLSSALDEYEQRFPPPSNQPEVFMRYQRHRLAELTETILSEANHLRKALARSELPVTFPKDLADRVRHLRNLYEHWEQHRDSFSNPELPKTDSGRWYADHHPGKAPWSASWSNQDGYIIGGILNLAELHAVLEEITATSP